MSHLLRALLREASYLPDATARDYFRRYIVARFKAYQPPANSTASFAVQAVARYRHRAFKRHHAAIIKDRAAQQLRTARKGLNFLRRANQGEGPCLQKILYFAYGRLGRRKYTLLADLLKPDPLAASSVAPLQTLYRSDLRCLQYFDVPTKPANGHHSIYISDRFPRLRAVITSQCANDVSLGRSIKRPYLKTPIRNVWEQPMPLKRAVNNVRRWYAVSMTRLLPALPVAEWDSIHAMSKGEQRIGFARRRTPVVESTQSTSHTSNTVSSDAFHLMLHHNLALDKLSKADRPQGINRPHTLTARYMQRLYGRLLTLSCKLEHDPTRNQWNAIWGKLTKNVKSNVYSAPVDPILFAGVDAKGITPTAPKSTKKNEPPKVPPPRTQDGAHMRFPFFAEMLPADHSMRIELDKWKKERAEAHTKWAAKGDV